MENFKTGYPSIDKTHIEDATFFEKHPIIPSIDIYNALKLISSSYKKDDAVNCLETTINFEELINNAAILSKSFKELGIKNDDIIVVCMPNYIQAITVYLAANRIGAVTTFLNASSSVDEIKHYLNLFESPLFVNYDKSMEYNQNIKKDTRVKQVVTLEKKDLNIKKFDSLSNVSGYSDFISFKDMQAVANYYKKPFRTIYGGNQNSLILFTSGSTGNPKSVLLTNKNILASGIYMKNSTHLSNVRGEKSLVCVPFSYPYGFVTSTLMSLLCGRQAILTPNLSYENISYFLEKKPNIVFGSPALLELIKRNVPIEQDLSSINTFISGGDFLTISQYSKAKQFFKDHNNSSIAICNGSGNAETTGASTNAVGLEIRPETVGKVLLGTDAIIMDEETGKELKYGEEGLLCINGKHVFKEYYKSPDITSQSKFVYKGKTYFKTGARGILDEQGYFTLTGRNTRFYIMSTLNKVYCDRVQNIISSIDIVDSCAVVKKPDKDNLFVGKAFIVLKDGVEPSQECIEYIKEKLKGQLLINGKDEYAQLKTYEIPNSFQFVSKLPRIKDADKIDYIYLEKLADEEYQQEKVKVLR